MKKKLLTLVLGISLACGVFTGCSKESEATNDRMINNKDSSTNKEVGSSTEETIDENEKEIEKEVETETEKMYTVTKSEAGNWLRDFMQLWLGCKVNKYLGNCDTNPVNISTMLEHKKIVGSLILDEDMRVVSDYNDKLFVLTPDININGYNSGDKNSINYRTSVTVKHANFNNFKYYKGTEQQISIVAELDFYIDDKRANIGDCYMAVVFENSTDNPDEWLLISAIKIPISAYSENSEDFYTSLLIDEDKQQEMESVNNSGLDDFVKSYTELVGYLNEYGTNRVYLIKVKDSDIPYLFYIKNGELNIYHYRNDEVVETNICRAPMNGGYIILANDNNIVISDYNDYDDHRLFKFDNGIVDVENGVLLNGDEYQHYYKKYINLTSNNGHLNILDAYKNMIIWD